MYAMIQAYPEAMEDWNQVIARGSAILNQHKKLEQNEPDLWKYTRTWLGHVCILTS